MTGARRYAWIAFWIISAHYLIGNFHRVCPAVVAPELISAFGISGASLGILASSYFFAYGAMQIPVGILADAWGVRRTVILFGGLTALGGDQALACPMILSPGAECAKIKELRAAEKDFPAWGDLARAAHLGPELTAPWLTPCSLQASPVFSGHLRCRHENPPR